MQADLPHVVIVGGGFGGLNAARGMRKTAVRVTLIDRTNHHLFQPLLYQVATAGLSPADIAVPIRSVIGRQANTEVLMGEVTGVDTGRRLVLLGERAISYDFLVLAPGSRYHYFGNDGWEGLAPSLKTVADATHIRRQILLAFEKAEMETELAKQPAHMTFVLIGGGPTGVEMAGSIGELAHIALARDFRHINPRSARILLVEAGPRILSAFRESLARKAHAALVRLGVEVRTNATVEAIDEEGVLIAGERLAAKTVIWCAGVVAAPVGQWLGVATDRGGRVRLELDLSLPEHPEVFVIGDAASVPGHDGRPLPGVAPVAMQQGRYVARVIHRRVGGREPPRPFRYADKGNLATVGRSFAIADFGWIRFSGLLAWLLWVAVHIFYLIDFRSRVLVMTEWIWAYITFRRGARLIVQERANQV